MGLRIMVYKVYDWYWKFIMVVENGLGVWDNVDFDGCIYDNYRILYFECYMEQVEFVVWEGVDIEVYFVWGIIDIVSVGSCEMEKRYGVVYVDVDNEGWGIYKWLLKDSFYWYCDFIVFYR